MKKIEVLGIGCPKCQKVEQVIREVLEKTGREAEVVKITDIKEIMTRGVMWTPAVMVDGEVMVQGKIPSPDEVRIWLDSSQTSS